MPLKKRHILGASVVRAGSCGVSKVAEQAIYDEEQMQNDSCEF